MLCQGLALRSIPKHFLKFAIATSKYSSSARRSKETHYEVLKLKNSCSPKQIRDAFIKLSKESHPDKNSDSSTHDRFVRINEAYNTLIKPDARREYDYRLSHQPKQEARNHVKEDPIYEKPFYDPSFYENRDRSKDTYYSSKPYYGVSGIDKISNSSLVMILIAFTIFGVGLQVLAIVNSKTSREEMYRQSKEIGDELSAIKKRADDYGTLDRQIEEMQRRRKGNS